MSRLKDKDDRWAPAIGKIMVSFGGIEHTTLLALSFLPYDRIFDSTKHLRLRQRIELIKEILIDRCASQPHMQCADQMIELLNEASLLAQKRNLIAHNPLVLTAFSDRDSNVKHREIIKSSIDPKKSISLYELEELAERLEIIDNELYQAFVLVSMRGID